MKEKTEQFTFFWKGPFSQWWPSPFKDSETVSYNYAEQYMMYQKALLFNDPETAAKILSTKSPREQKAWGRKVRSFDEGR